MLEEMKGAVIFLLAARFLQMLVCRQEHQKYIRGFIGLLTICMLLPVLYSTNTKRILWNLENTLFNSDMAKGISQENLWETYEKVVQEADDSERQIKPGVSIENKKNYVNRIHIPKIKIRVILNE